MSLRAHQKEQQKAVLTRLAHQKGLMKAVLIRLVHQMEQLMVEQTR